MEDQNWDGMPPDHSWDESQPTMQLYFDIKSIQPTNQQTFSTFTHNVTCMIRLMHAAIAERVKDSVKQHLLDDIHTNLNNID